MLDPEVRAKFEKTEISKSDIDQAVRVLGESPDHQVLKKVPEPRIIGTAQDSETLFHGCIIDCESMGLDPEIDKIIEIGLLRFSFSPNNGIIEVLETYGGLEDPGCEVPVEITEITGITTADVKGQSIDWKMLSDLLERTDLVICHNSDFDRKMLEAQTPEHFSNIVRCMAFGCSMKDIQWRLRGYGGLKLDYLNFKMGYFYLAHRALGDCWATFNLFIEEKGSYAELLGNVRKQEKLICATQAAFELKDTLKDRGYIWSDGTKGIPKSWWCTVDVVDEEEELAWLDTHIYGGRGVGHLPNKVITARTRYSKRVKMIS